jgi:hypothetical protein
MLEVQRRDWKAIESGAMECREAFQSLLAQTLSDGPPWQIDEVALQFAGKQQMDKFVSDARVHGWATIGDKGIDTVKCEPLSSSCVMRYAWLNPMLNDPKVLYRENFAGRELVLTNNWRVECMRVASGYNPLLQHWQWMVGYTPGAEHHVDNLGWTHAAFKVPTLEMFQDVCYTLERRNWQGVQLCTSGYGQFAYFRMHPEWLEAERQDHPRLPYLCLKVRVNLRDQ